MIVQESRAILLRMPKERQAELKYDIQPPKPAYQAIDTSDPSVATAVNIIRDLPSCNPVGE
jgi:hypothetical protein